RRLGQLPLLARLGRRVGRQRAEVGLDAPERRLQLLGAVLGLGAALVDVQRREADEREQLEELRLPVLEGRLAELGEEVAELRRRALRRLLVGVLLPLRDQVADPRREEQRDER